MNFTSPEDDGEPVEMSGCLHDQCACIDPTRIEHCDCYYDEREACCCCSALPVEGS